MQRLARHANPGSGDCSGDCGGGGAVSTREAAGTKSINAHGITIQSQRGVGVVSELFIDSTSITSYNFSNDSKLVEIYLSWSDISTLDQFVFPPKLRKLDLEANLLTEIPQGKIPDTVTTLLLDKNSFKTMDNVALPDSLENLYLYESQLVAINFTFPPRLKALHLDGTNLPILERINLTSSMETFSCIKCKTTAFRGIQLSPNLKTLDLDGNDLAEFEIRESDRKILLGLETYNGKISQSACAEPSATVMAYMVDYNVCVISDALFTSKYAYPLKERSPESESKPASESKPTTMILIIVILGTLVVVFLVAVAVYRVVANKNRSKFTSATEDLSSGLTVNAQGITGSTDQSSNQDAGYLANDIRNDQAIIPFRIAQDEIQVTRRLAKGGFGVVYLGKFRGRHVAIKQLLPEKARDNTLIKSFMDEIRLCSKLEHPKVVSFIGLTWSTLLDLAVVIEFMGGGDLRSVLYVDSRLPEPDDWFDASCNLKSKTALALDVIEALVYLHSFENPIIHRDLKARNVLLSEDGDAKLSDFGISREVTLDETMTAEIGTVAWIAPEVLQGERYSEKADIYSFGVLLAELDTCAQPYKAVMKTTVHGEIDTKVSNARTNTRIAMLVSSNALKPALSTTCPASVQELTMRCLSFTAEDRPSAIEIHYALRKIQHSAHLATHSFV